MKVHEPPAYAYTHARCPESTGFQAEYTEIPGLIFGEIIKIKRDLINKLPDERFTPRMFEVFKKVAEL